MRKDWEFDFEFDKGMILTTVLLAIIPPVGLIMLVKKLKGFKRGRNDQKKLRNMGITTMLCSLIYLFLRIGRWGALVFCTGLGLTLGSELSRRKEERFRRYLAIIGGRSPVALAEIAARCDRTVAQVESDLKTMIDQGYFGLATFIDHNRHCIVLDGMDDVAWTSPYEQPDVSPKSAVWEAGPTRQAATRTGPLTREAADEKIERVKAEQAAAEKAAAEKKAAEKKTTERKRFIIIDKPDTGSEAPQPTAEESPKREKAEKAKPQQDDQFGRRLSEIRELNDRIADPVISAKIDRIEGITSHIFEIVRRKPEKLNEIRKFMNYYLPTTLKLLDSYALLEEQGIEGDNISASKEQINQILDTLIQSFEKQLDLLFTAQAMDINSDIEVLENMMAADGLKESDFKLKPQARH